MLLHIKAEREGEFSLHLYAYEKMVPCFFAAGLRNYARDSICYLCSMEKLSGNILNKFRKGKHVMNHQKGLWNGIWSNMMIEITYRKYQKFQI